MPEAIKITNRDLEEVNKAACKTVGFPDGERSVGGSGNRRKWNTKEKDARYRSLFGAPLVVITAAWKLIKQFVANDVYIKHLIYTMVFLKTYAKNQEIHCAIVDWPTVKNFSENILHVLRVLYKQSNQHSTHDYRTIHEYSTYIAYIILDYTFFYAYYAHSIRITPNS